MKVIYGVKELQSLLKVDRDNNKTIGFVPTMGALHQGHIELVKRCVAENDISVVSIFVNPTQFNDKNDLQKYPRTLDADCKLLEEVGNTYVFAPSETEIYPEPDTREFGFGSLETVMEGKFRPGHFNGVAQIVSRLFEMVAPNNAYFGEKDFQQLAIVKELVKQFNIPVKIIPCSIVRESDGLAMSSRNTRLSETQRKTAPSIYKTLFESKALAEKYTVDEVKLKVVNTLNSLPELDVEYFDIVDALSLQSIQNWKDSDNPVGCIAVFAGEVRLIDNISYKMN
ncbi:pantoate--beta-alanine ligase [Dysgonomonadaceae bacterium PH5-43]|nr:pantoate--beta-alanine ligase [Dysgonomonadaceae bacterium PH5-43]